MEEILHFPGHRRLSNKNRHLTVQPSISDNEGDKDNEAVSPLIKKKSHFSAEKPENLAKIDLHECELGDDETHSPLST